MDGFFASGVWGSVLREGMGGQVVFAPASGNAAPLPWAVFRRGPLSAAYPRFPIGLVAGDEAVLDDLAAIGARLRAQGVHLLRLSAPEALLAGRAGIAVESRLPETVIADLPGWTAATLPAALRRKLRQGEKAGLTVRPVDAADGPALHALYRRTLARHWGSARYSPDYFSRLCGASREHRDLSVAKVLTPDGRLAAFVAVAHHDGVAYYLHGGYDDAFSAARPGYFAMRWALEQARDRGDRAFNFLASPAGQPALREYKESFGGQSLPRCHWQLPLTPLGHVAAAALRLLEARKKPARDRAQASASNSTSA